MAEDILKGGLVRVRVRLRLRIRVRVRLRLRVRMWVRGGGHLYEQVEDGDDELEA